MWLKIDVRKIGNTYYLFNNNVIGSFSYTSKKAATIAAINLISLQTFDNQGLATTIQGIILSGLYCLATAKTMPWLVKY